MKLFITLEGPDGSGKSTQARLLCEYLKARGEDVVLTREPGGTKIGEQIREIIHSHRNTEMSATTECLLYNAARAQIVAEIIRPALADDKIVIADRYADSTLAYQGYGRQLPLDYVRAAIEFATGGLVPDLTFFVDVSVEDGIARRVNGQQRGEELNRMDAQSRDFYERAREGYEHLMRAEPQRWRRINGAQSIQQVQSDLRREMDFALEQARVRQR